jgi:hypothetical protein
MPARSVDADVCNASFGRMLKGEIQCTHIADSRCCRKWSYSFKSLMFFSFVVAICSAIIGVSVVLAAVCLPFIVGALVRTMRIHGRTTPGEQSPGLFVTFCRSLTTMFCLIAVSAIAFIVACCAGVLIMLGIARHLIRPVAVVLTVSVRRLSHISIYVWHHLRSPAVHAKFAEVFFMIRDFAITTTRSLFAACRTLWRRWWFPERRYT